MEREEFEIFAKGIRPKMLIRATALLGDSADAADAVQDSMLKLWFFRHRLREYSSPVAPAMVILRRECFTRLRTKRLTEPLAAADTLEGEMMAEENPELSAAIAALPPVEQAVLRMKHIEEMETEEIASLTGSTPGAVRAALSRARKRVRDTYLKLQS